MKKLIGILFFFLIGLSVSAQTAVFEDVVYLKNGEMYRGEIVTRTDDIILLKTDDGKRFQFQLSDIQKIVRQEKKIEVAPKDTVKSQGNFAMLAGLNVGVGTAKGAIVSSPIMDAALSLGVKNIGNRKTFFGAGVGYRKVFRKDIEKLDFLPLFLHVQSVFGNTIIAPAVNIKTGYAFHLQDIYKGGLFADVSGGIHISLNEQNSLYFGLFGQLQRIYGKVTEINPLGTFTSQSNAVISGFGVTATIMF